MLIEHNLFILKILEKIKEMRLKFSQGSVAVLQKMADYEEARVEPTNTQLNKLQSPGTISRLNKKDFEDEELPHESCLITKETTKIRNAFANMSNDKKRSKAQISRIIQSDRSFGSFLAYLGKKALKKCCFSFT